jgi:peptidyl-prolyl cis-trans isomerase A (cyclophilin A)
MMAGRSRRLPRRCLVAAFLLLGSITLSIAQRPNTAVLLDPKHPEMHEPAPESFKVLLDTSKGAIAIEIRREWSPNGVDRFYNLVRHGYYDGARFFRIRAGQWAQFGIAVDPRISSTWRSETIPDDPRRLSNVRGTIAYAFRDPNGRTTQVFINLRDNSATHDAEPFVPFGRVLQGMEVADALYSEYGEEAGGGIRAGRQDKLFEEGNAYLEREFPRLDYIKQARVIR